MAEFGAVFAGISSVMLLITAGCIYVDSINRTTLRSVEDIKNASSIRIQELQSGASVSSVTVDVSRRKLDVNLLNIGSIRICRADFQRMDAFLTYIDDSTGIKQTYWFYFNSSDTSKHRWRLTPGVTPNPFPAVVNPLDWDPSETLSITLELPSSNQIRRKTDAYVSVVLPSGYKCGRAFYVG